MNALLQFHFKDTAGTNFKRAIKEHKQASNAMAEFGSIPFDHGR